MRHEMAITANVRRFLVAVRGLKDRPAGLEGMGVLTGLPGEGKTTTLAFVARQLHGIYLRSMRCWTATSMLGDLCHELRLERQRQKAPMVSAIIERLGQDPCPDGTTRPIFIDEADYLADDMAMLNTLRDIYDMVPGAAVILVGEDKFAVKLQNKGRFARRITQWIEFSGVSIDDTRVLTETVCEMPVADDLLAYLHAETSGNIGRMVVGLARIEAFGKSNGNGPGNPVTRQVWGERQLYYDQPTFGRKP